MATRKPVTLMHDHATDTDIVPAKKTIALSGPVVDTDEIVNHLVGLRDEADASEGVALRADVKDDETLGRAADVVKSITTVLKDTSDKRLAFTKPARDFTESVNALYGLVVIRLTKAKTDIEKKISAYQETERKRRQAELDRQREEDERRAKELAAVHVELGDSQGAQDILDTVAALPVVAAPVRAVGMYGGSVSQAARYDVQIKDKRQFLYELALRKEAVIEAVLDDINFGQRSLTALAKAVENEDILPVNGFEFTVFNKPIVR